MKPWFLRQVPLISFFWCGATNFLSLLQLLFCFGRNVRDHVLSIVRNGCIKSSRSKQRWEIRFLFCFFQVRLHHALSFYIPNVKYTAPFWDAAQSWQLKTIFIDKKLSIIKSYMMPRHSNSSILTKYITRLLRRTLWGRKTSVQAKRNLKLVFVGCVPVSQYKYQFYW